MNNGSEKGTERKKHCGRKNTAVLQSIRRPTVRSKLLLSSS